MEQNEWFAYAAGFFDGEGCYCISQVRVKDKPTQHRLVVAIGQHADRAHIILEFQRVFGGTVQYKVQGKTTYKPGSPIVFWLLQKRSDVERFVRAVHPYLMCKKLQADIALQFIETSLYERKATRANGRWSGSIPLTDDQLANREELRLMMRDANTLSNGRLTEDVS